MAASVFGLRSRFGEWWQAVVRMAHAMWAIIFILPFRILHDWLDRKAMAYLACRNDDFTANYFMTMLWMNLKYRNGRELLTTDELTELFERRAKEIGHGFDSIIADATREVAYQGQRRRKLQG